MFSNFMINTWAVASLVAVTAGLVGFFVVIRGASFAAHTIPLSTFPGAAAAVLLGVNQVLGLILAACLSVIGINALSRRGQPDVATAMTLVMMLGLGTLCLSQISQYSQQVYALLFGQVFGISRASITPLAIIDIFAAGALLMLFRPLLLSSLSTDLSQTRYLTATRLDLAFLIILALASAVALPVVGALLVFSLMVGPASAARNVTSRPVIAMGVTVLISLITVWTAIVLSYVTNWPVGFFVGGFGAMAYGAGRGAMRIRRWKPSPIP